MKFFLLPLTWCDFDHKRDHALLVIYICTNGESNADLTGLLQGCQELIYRYTCHRNAKWVKRYIFTATILKVLTSEQLQNVRPGADIRCWREISYFRDKEI